MPTHTSFPGSSSHGGRVSVQFSSVTQLCPTLWGPMDCSTPGLPVHHYSRSPPKLMSIESVMPSNHLIPCHPLLLLLSIFPSIGVCQMSQLFESGGQSLGVSASASVLRIQLKANEVIIHTKAHLLGSTFSWTSLGAGDFHLQSLWKSKPHHDPPLQP